MSDMSILKGLFALNPEREAARALLMRPATEAESPNGPAILRRGGSFLRLRAAVLVSPAYFRTRGGASPAGFLLAAYRGAVRRDPTPDELKQGVVALAAGIPRPLV